MRLTRVSTAAASVMWTGLVLVGLGGCDYWPPALQTQIEQLRADVQKAQQERANMEAQLNEATAAKNVLQANVDELMRVNKDLMAKVTHLEQSLVAEREKLAKLSKPAAGKAGTKKPAKASGKKKPAKVPSPKRP